jgi:hypothetical protein
MTDEVPSHKQQVKHEQFNENYFRHDQPLMHELRNISCNVKLMTYHLSNTVEI